MKYAIAMYRAGFQVAADDCDHESAKKLGLICPFCKEAVFLRKGSYHERSGRQVSVPSSFAHYHSDDPTAQQCELRAKRQEGQEYLQRLEIESRNQRLKLFNNHLWEMFASQIGIGKAELSQVQKRFGRKGIGRFSRAMAKHWQKREAKGLNYDDVVKAIKDFKKRQTELYLKRAAIEDEELTSESASDFDIEGPVTLPDGIGPGMAYGLVTVSDPILLADFANSPEFMKVKQSVERKRRQQQADWLFGVDKQLHLSICKEICSFLGTKTAGYAFEKLCMICLRDFRSRGYDIPADGLAHDEDAGNVIGWWISVYIANVHWLEEIKKRGDWQI